MKAYIQSPLLWPLITQVKLASNMRVYGEEVSFSSYLLANGEGSENVHTNVGEDIIQTPKKHLMKTIEALIEKVFPLAGTCYPDKYFMSRCAILTPRNDTADMINE